MRGCCRLSAHLEKREGVLWFPQWGDAHDIGPAQITGSPPGDELRVWMMNFPLREVEHRIPALSSYLRGTDTHMARELESGGLLTLDEAPVLAEIQERTRNNFGGTGTPLPVVQIVNYTTPVGDSLF